MSCDALYVFQTGLLSFARKESNQRNWPSAIFIRLFPSIKRGMIKLLPICIGTQTAIIPVSFLLSLRA
jgi:hypothetical protein